MGNRCESCSKFVGLEAADPEVQSTEILSAGEIAEDGTQEVEVGANVDLVLNCAECGSEMGRANVDGSDTFTLTHNKVKPEDAEEGAEEVMCDAGEDDLETEEDSVEATDDFRPPGRPARYQKHYYGADVSVHVTCSKCGADDTFTVKAEAQASEFEQ